MATSCPATTWVAPISTMAVVSRATLSATAARHQLARDLHDGAQQRLVTLLLGLQLARDQTVASEDRALLDDAIEQACAALDELRELAAGIHPPILTALGLPAAVKALAARSALPGTISAATPGRLGHC